MNDNSLIAIALALAAGGGITVCVVYWSVTSDLSYPFPRAIQLACIGGSLALGGAVCFAIAAFLGG
jgi:hypothetical protein